MSIVEVRVAIPFLFCLMLVGCSGTKDPKQLLIGRWSGDMSAVAIGSRIADLKGENPGASGSAVIAGAKNMGMIALDLRADGTATAVHQTFTYEGTWKFDAARSEVEFDLDQTNPPLPAVAAGAAQNAPAKRTAWIATLDPKTETLELFMGDRAAFDFFKEVSKGKRSGLFVLKKK